MIHPYWSTYREQLKGLLLFCGFFLNKISRSTWLFANTKSQLKTHSCQGSTNFTLAKARKFNSLGGEKDESNQETLVK